MTNPHLADPKRHNLGTRRYLARQIVNRLGASARRADILHVGDTEAFSPVPMKGGTLYRAQEPSTTGGNLDFERDAPLPDTRRSQPLAIIAGIGLLADWHGLKEDLDRLIADRELIVIAMIRYGFEPLPIAGHEYLLSALLSQVPYRNYTMDIDVYPPPGTRVVPWLNLMPVVGAALYRYHRWREALFGTPVPTGFAALTISIRKRGRKKEKLRMSWPR